MIREQLALAFPHEQLPVLAIGVGSLRAGLERAAIQQQARRHESRDHEADGQPSTASRAPSERDARITEPLLANRERLGPAPAPSPIFEQRIIAPQEATWLAALGPPPRGLGELIAHACIVLVLAAPFDEAWPCREQRLVYDLDPGFIAGDRE